MQKNEKFTLTWKIFRENRYSVILVQNNHLISRNFVKMVGVQYMTVISTLCCFTHCENSIVFFCLLDFPSNQFFSLCSIEICHFDHFQTPFVNFLRFFRLRFARNCNSKAKIMILRMTVFEGLNLWSLISRKIWVTGKSSHFRTVQQRNENHKVDWATQ